MGVVTRRRIPSDTPETRLERTQPVGAGVNDYGAAPVVSCLVGSTSAARAPFKMG